MSSIRWTDDDTVVGVDVYRSEDYIRVGRVGAAALLRTVFEPVLNRRLDGDVEFRLSFHAVTDAGRLPGPPMLVNLRQTHGFVTVHITAGSTVLYRHLHSVREILAAPLQRFLAGFAPEVGHWGFGVSGPGLGALALIRPAPPVAGAANLRIAGNRRRLHVERVPEPSPKPATLSDFTITGGPSSPSHDATGSSTGPVVVLSSGTFEQLMHGLPSSDEVEDGGFLAGELYTDARASDAHLVYLTHVLPAERTGASMLEFTYTGESFLRVNDTIAGLGGEVRLIGWYHTHLFRATDEPGLSSIDVDLHTRTFMRRWQLAVLLNLSEGERHLRIYAWDGARMRHLRFWVGNR